MNRSHVEDNTTAMKKITFSGDEKTIEVAREVARRERRSEVYARRDE
ncbi:MAG: hypothetical protein WAK29_02040 [Terriglobales bacterium]